MTHLERKHPLDFIVALLLAALLLFASVGVLIVDNVIPLGVGAIVVATVVGVRAIRRYYRTSRV